MTTPILNGWKEIANFLKVHEQTAMKLAEKNGLPVTRVGGLVLASVNQIDKWMAKNSNFDNSETS